ncbi:hypothetical protein [Flagellimonas marinaquae]
MKSYRHFTKVFALLPIILGLSLPSQEKTPGESYFPNGNNYVEYIYGDHPVIISIPHDGDLAPEYIPDRS